MRCGPWNRMELPVKCALSSENDHSSTSYELGGLCFTANNESTTYERVAISYIQRKWDSSGDFVFTIHIGEEKKDHTVEWDLSFEHQRELFRKIESWLTKMEELRKNTYYVRCTVAKFSKGCVGVYSTEDSSGRMIEVPNNSMPNVSMDIGRYVWILRSVVVAATHSKVADAVKAVKAEGALIHECCGHKTENAKWRDCVCVRMVSVQHDIRTGGTCAYTCPCVKSAFFNAQREDDRRILEDQRQLAEKFTNERRLFDAEDFSSLGITYKFPNCSQVDFYQKGKLRWSIVTKGKEFHRHTTEISRRLDINGENEVFVLSVHYDGKLLKDICCFKNREKLQSVRNDLDYYLKKVDDMREKQKKEQEDLDKAGITFDPNNPRTAEEIFVSEFLPLNLTSKFEKHCTNFYQKGKLSWVISAEDKEFCKQTTEITRRLDTDGKNAIFVLSVRYGRLAFKDICWLNNRKDLETIRVGLRDWLDDVDEERRRRHYKNLCIQHYNYIYAIAKTNENASERYYIRSDSLPRDFRYGAYSFVNRHFLIDWEDEKVKREVSTIRESRKEDQDDLDKVCAELENDEAIGRTINHKGQGEIINPPECRASSSAASSRKLELELTAETIAKLHPFPLVYEIENAVKGTLRVCFGKHKVGAIRWSRKTPNPLTLRVVDLGDENVTIVFDTLANNITPHTWTHYRVPRERREQVFAQWTEKAREINNAARKLAEDTENAKAKAEKLKAEVTFDPNNPRTTEEILRVKLAEKQAERVLSGIEEELGEKARFSDSNQRAAFLKKLSDEICISVKRFDDHKKWFQHCFEFAVSLLREMIGARQFESDTTTDASLVCAEGIMRSAEKMIDGPIYLSDDERNEVRVDIAKRIVEAMSAADADSELVYATTLKFTTSLLKDIQKENRAKLNVHCNGLGSAAEAIADFIRKMQAGEAPAVCGLRVDLDTGKVSNLFSPESEDGEAASSDSNKKEEEKSETVTVRCLTCGHVSPSENETPCRCQPPSEEPAEDVEPEEEPNIVRGTTRYGLNLYFSRENRKLRVGGGFVSLPEREKGTPNDPPSVFSDIDGDDSRYLKVIIRYRGKSKTVIRMDNARDAALFCQDLGDWLVKHHNNGFFD